MCTTAEVRIYRNVPLWMMVIYLPFLAGVGSIARVLFIRLRALLGRYNPTLAVGKREEYHRTMAFRRLAMVMLISRGAVGCCD